MRTTFSILILLLFMSTALQAQELYVRAHGSLATPAARDIVEVSQTTDSTGFTRQQNVVTTLGGGAMYGLDVGYLFSEYFGAEIGFQYLASTKILARETLTPTIDIIGKAYTRMGRVTLGVTMNTGGDGVRGFTRMGALLPVLGATFIEADFTLKPPLTPGQSFSRTRNEGKFSVGWYGGIGVEYPIGDRLRLSAEASLTYLRVKTQSQTIIEQYDVNTGEDLLPGLNVSEREIIYRDELNSDSNNRTLNFANYDVDQPEELLAYTSNYSNAGIRLGIAFRLFH